jgi:hypothetical protein
VDEGWSVAIERGASSTRQDCYRVSALDPDDLDTPKTWEYTKLGGKVPDQVAEVLNLRELNFAGQFDGPYLLAQTAGDVARELGRLTNVTLIFAAAREGARRKKALAADLAAAEREVTRLAGEAQRFAGLRRRVQAVQAAEEAMQRHIQAQSQAGALRSLLERLRAAQGTVASIVLPPLAPDLAAMEAAHDRSEALCEIVSRITASADVVQSFQQEAYRLHEAQALAEAQVAKALSDAGRCPTCGRAIDSSHADAQVVHGAAGGGMQG